MQLYKSSRKDKSLTNWNTKLHLYILVARYFFYFQLYLNYQMYYFKSETYL